MVYNSREWFRVATEQTLWCPRPVLFFIEQTPANNSVFTLLYVIISVNIVNIVLLVNWHCIGIYIHYGVACVSP